MTRFYGKRTEENEGTVRYFITIAQENDSAIEIEVSEAIYFALDDMQREYWRLDRRESRHTLHIEMMNEGALPMSPLGKNPAQLLVEKIEADNLWRTFRQIPIVQQRRFLMRYVLCLPIDTIAQYEGCSRRAIKYSLALAKKNLQDILSE